MAKKNDTAKAMPEGLNQIAAAMMAVNPAASKAWLALMNESARFVTERFQQDMDLQRRMLECTNPAELMALQAEFYQGAVSDYAAEANRMLKMMTDATQETIESAQTGQKRDHDDVPL